MVGMVIDGLEFHDRLGPQNYELVTRTLEWRGPIAMEDILAGINLRDAMIADVGIGTGQLSHIFRRAQAQVVIGVDGSEDFLRAVMASRKADSVVLADLKHDQIPLANDSMDLVTCSGVLSYLEDPLNAIQQMARITRMGGYIAVNFHPARNPMDRESEQISAASLFKDVAGIRRVVYTLYHQPTAEITGIFSINGCDYVKSAVTTQGVRRAETGEWVPLSTHLFRKTNAPFVLPSMQDHYKFV